MTLFNEKGDDKITWGDYGISAVKYNSEGTHIDQVKIHENIKGGVGDAVIWERTSVVSALSNNNIITILKNDTGGWNAGAKVIKDIVNGKTYIKTVADSTTRDNLDHLPKF